ncbi:flagellin [Hypnocyclicus thermotrophus]|uniref:Flagellin n=1 Tax=Hypnocyclicus thermotrophus TaxID=1627895 RepID=A0AA46DY35_9FUSO|nr:flagellin Hag [Hypnocyclicus thermotrophus]TDT69236.1 flagellin [Hypnocyclicus thermotrophus]
MIINNNITALNSYRNLTDVNNRVSKSMEKLSSGLRINRAGDDAAGLAISEKMRGQIKGLNMARKNSQDAISLIQTAEGALNETHSILQRMRELAVQAANDTNTQSDRKQIQKEMNQLRQEIDRISKTTEFNTKKLLNGDFNGQNGSKIRFQVGANEGQTVELTFNDMSAKTLRIAQVKRIETDNGTKEVDTGDAISVTDANSAQKAITTINNAIETVSEERAKYGAVQNRLEHTINNLAVSAENLQAAESRIRDTDMAKEMVALSKDKIISQSGTAMLAQANTAPQNILQLLR